MSEEPWLQKVFDDAKKAQDKRLGFHELELSKELDKLRADNTRLEAELSQLRGSEPCDECGVDTVKLLDERDKLRADNTRLEAENAGIRALLKLGHTLERNGREQIARLEGELKDANYWRERHSKDAEAYGKQSQKNWESASKLTEVVKACEVAACKLELEFECLSGYLESVNSAQCCFIEGSANSSNSSARLLPEPWATAMDGYVSRTRERLSALIHTLQSGEKKEGAK